MMDRRRFLGTMLGAGAGLALPSEVWPFRKYFLPFFYRPFSFLPPFAKIDPLIGVNGNWAAGMEAAVQALQLENLREQIPDLLLNEATFYGMLKRGQLNIKVGDVLTVDEDGPVARAANQVLRTLKF